MSTVASLSVGDSCVCVLKGFSAWGVSYTEIPPFQTRFSTKAVHWAVDNRITCTPHEHIGQLVDTRRDKSVPLDLHLFPYNTHTEEMPSLGTYESVSCLRPWLAPPPPPFPPASLQIKWLWLSLCSFPLLLWFSAKWNSWLYLDLYFLLRCFPDVCVWLDAVFWSLVSQVTLTNDLSFVWVCESSRWSWLTCLYLISAS